MISNRHTLHRHTPQQRPTAVRRARHSHASRRVTRRQVLGRLAAGIVVPSIVAPSALGAGLLAPPSERIVVGLIGIGAMGQGHLAHLLKYDDVQVAAVCDVDRWRRQNAQRTVEQTYAARTGDGGFRGCSAYNDFRELLGRDDIDAVLIATGDRWHAVTTVMAAQAGKDIYCEKPISLTVREAQAMVAAVQRYSRVFQGGFQQRSTPEFHRACQLVQQGAIGKVELVYVTFPGANGDVELPPEPVPDGLDWDLWLGPAPYRPYNQRFHPYGKPPRVVPWDFCRDFGGGNLASNAVHSFDIVQWALGMDDSGPVEVIPPETDQVPLLTYKYTGDVMLQVAPWRLDPQKHHIPKGWDPNTAISAFGAVYVGQHGWIHVGRQGFLTAYPADVLKQEDRSLARTHSVHDHHRNWLDCIRSRGRTASTVQSAARSTIVAHLGCVAHWTGRALRWDPQKMEFTGDQQASRWLWRPMREPWTL